MRLVFFLFLLVACDGSDYVPKNSSPALAAERDAAIANKPTAWLGCPSSCVSGVLCGSDALARLEGDVVRGPIVIEATSTTGQSYRRSWYVVDADGQADDYTELHEPGNEVGGPSLSKSRIEQLAVVTTEPNHVELRAAGARIASYSVDPADCAGTH